MKINIEKKYLVLIGVSLIIIILWIFLPLIVLNYANKTLTTVKGFYGHIDDIDLHIFRGAYTLNRFYFNKIDPVTKKQIQFVKAQKIDLSIEWRALFQGTLVGKLIFYTPELIFTKDIVELSDLEKNITDFGKLLKTFMPLHINRFEVTNGMIQYIDNTSQPKINISLKKAHILARNLSNATNSKAELPSTITAEASVYEGSIKLDMKLNALATNATFEMNAEITNINLVLLNDFLKAYGNFDVNQGRFGLYTEMAAKEGKFIGYIKPIITDLKVLGPQNRNDTALQKIWASILEGINFVFKNQERDQLATKIWIEGNFKDPHPNIPGAIWEILRNAFIQALMPIVDNEINIHSVKINKPKSKRKVLDGSLPEESKPLNKGDN